MYKILFLLIAILYIPACATKKVAVQARFPAAHPEATQLKKIIVLDFNGDTGSSFTTQLTSELKTAKLDGQLLFSVMSQDVIKSHIRSSSNKLSAIMSYGRKLGIQGIYYGNVTPLEITKRNWQEERVKCTEYKSFLKCKTKKKSKVTCYEQLATYSVQPKLVDIKIGDVVYTENISKNATNKYCTDKGQEFSKADFVSFLQNIVVKKIRRQVAPYNDVFNVQLKADTTGLSPAAEQKFDSAMAFGKAERMDRACAIWQELSVTMSESKNSISLLYNLGVCAEIVADYDRAIDLYSKADSMLLEPDKVIFDAKNRAVNLKNNQKSI